MNDRANDGGSGAGGLLALVLILLLLAAGGGFFLFQARGAVRARQAAVEAEITQARLAQAAATAAAAEAPADGIAGGQDLSSAEGDGVRSGVEAVLREQERAWNRGDINAFAEYYWKSDDVTFSSGGKTTRGWQATVDGYHERYPTPEKMGRVTFSNLEITPLGDAAALVLGEWKLERESEPLGGNFSLVFRKIDGRWVIIHDHTSRLLDSKPRPEPAE